MSKYRGTKIGCLYFGLRAVLALMVCFLALNLQAVGLAENPHSSGSESDKQPATREVSVLHKTPMPKPPFVSKPPVPLTFSANPADTEFLKVRLFSERLMPMGGKTGANENRALAEAILAFAKNSSPDNTAPLTQFLATYPKSAWRVSLLTNLGSIYRRGGYWFEAFGAWQRAWTLGKKEKDPVHALIVDRAAGELAYLIARAGWNDYLKLLIEEIGDRVLCGPGEQYLSKAKCCLYMMETNPQKTYRCGPIAVHNLLGKGSAAKSRSYQIKEPRPNVKGTTLAQLKKFAKDQGLNYQIAFRNPGAAIITPCIVNWKFGHHAALTSEKGGGYQVEDATMSDRLVISKQAIEQETSGYFLVPGGALPDGWRKVEDAEGAAIWGKGPVDDSTNPPPPTRKKCPKGMADYNVDESRINLTVMDAPLFYTPPRGAPIEFEAAYSQRDVAPATPNYPNLGFQWNTNWVSYVVDDPYNMVTTTYGPAGGVLTYGDILGGYTSTSATTGSFSPQLSTQSVLVRTSGTSYMLLQKDGSKIIYGLADTQSNPMHIYMTEYDDPARNRTVYSYDLQNFRLMTVTDAIGLSSTLTYVSDTDTGNGDFYRIATVTDPFGRTAGFHYNSTGQLDQITDMIGLTSNFEYGPSNFLNAMATPYSKNLGTSGTATAFVYTEDNSGDKSLLVTDPNGGQEFYQFMFDMNSPDLGGITPNQSLINANTSYQEYRTTYFWDKKAYAEHPGDYSAARLKHWLHTQDAHQMGDVLESEKKPLEYRVYYNYPGMRPDPSNAYISAGTSNQPSKIGRVLDDGSTQLTQYEHNFVGKVTRAVDPLSRATVYQYDPTGYDLTAIYQLKASGSDRLMAATYNSQHLPLTMTDAAGQTTRYSYNSYGQILSCTNSKNEVTSFTYNHQGVGETDGYLISIDGPLSSHTTLGYDEYGRLSDVTDPQGYSVHTDYDALNRPTKKYYGVVGSGSSMTYNSYEETTYDMLSIAKFRDRNGQYSGQSHNALGLLVTSTDALFNVTNYSWCGCGALESITDPKGNVTTWVRDIQGRPVTKIFPDQSTINYGYSNATGILTSTTDALNQVTHYAYYSDNNIRQISYEGGMTVTPSVGYSYDPYYNRLSTMTDGQGTTHYTYNPINNTPGAGQLYSIEGPLANSTITYGYDELGRIINRSINGAENTSSVTYDALGRTGTGVNQLGTFNYAYVGATSRLDHVNFPNGQSTTYAYYPNVAASGAGNGDQRLQEIKNLDSTPAVISKFDYAYDGVGRILQWTQTNSAQTGGAVHYDFGYDLAGQLLSGSLKDVSDTLLIQYGYQYDAAGNRWHELAGTATTEASFNNLNQISSRTGDVPFSNGMMTVQGTVNKVAQVLIGGTIVNGTQVGGIPALVKNGTFTASVAVTAGTNNIPVSAKDGSGNVTTKSLSLSLSGQNFDHDSNGNLISDLGRTFEWDAANRLVAINYSATSGTTRTEFTYNGLGQRIKIVEKVNGSSTTARQFVWCPGDTQPSEERDASNTVTKRFFPQGEQIANESYFYTKDHLGSIRELTGSDGVIHARYDYDPFGRRSANMITNNAVEADFAYAGYFNHAPSGLYGTLYRFYSPDQGRWISRDPLGEDGGLNLYGYVGGNPIKELDPLGLASININLTGAERGSMNIGNGSTLYVDRNTTLKIDNNGGTLNITVNNPLIIVAPLMGLPIIHVDISALHFSSSGLIFPGGSGVTASAFMLPDSMFQDYLSQQIYDWEGGGGEYDPLSLNGCPGNQHKVRQLNQLLNIIDGLHELLGTPSDLNY